MAKFVEFTTGGGHEVHINPEHVTLVQQLQSDPNSSKILLLGDKELTVEQPAQNAVSMLWQT